MKTAIPGQATTAAQGWVLYDGECSLCTRCARRCAALLHRHGFELAPLQTGWVSARFGLNPSARPAEMLVLLPDGHALGGADGLVQIARRIWWAWPLFALAQLPGMLPVLRTAYRHVAARRNCREGACELPPRRQAGDWTMLLVLPVLVLLSRDLFPPWFFMWLLAGALYFGCKWLTWRRGMRQVGEVDRALSYGYLFGWVGMDAKKFFTPANLDFKPKWKDCLPAAVKVLAGVTLVWLVVRHLVVVRPLLAGWVGMFGLILCLHFGLFQLLAVAWQRAGINAPPLMREPLRAVSLADFWGRRWNGAFHYLANDLIFRPLAGWVGAAGAMFIVFLFSGLVHNLIISVPAHGGYGLPTTYFLIQGLGILFERTTLARRLGLGRGWRGWLFTVICAAVPAYWLFPPVFIRHVILPMLHAFGAT